MEARQEVASRLFQIISERLEVQPDDIKETSTWAQLGADSLDRLDLSLAIEEFFMVEIPPTVGEKLDSVGDTINHLLALK